MEDINLFLSSLPTLPGVYRMLDQNKKLLYVGKAKNLKKRISSYFKSSGLDVKTSSLVKQISNIEFTLVNSESAALLLENNCIKKYRPRYNVLLKDDKTYPCLLLTRHDFPRLDLTRNPKKDCGQVFGPFPSVSVVRDCLALIQKLFKIRQCSDVFFKNRSRPCLQYQINRCTAPCVKYVSKEDYSKQVAHARLFLEGKNNDIINELSSKMEILSSQKKYEEAAFHRDTIAKLRSLQQKQVAGSSYSINVDIVQIYQHLGRVAITIVALRQGRLLGHKTHFPTVPSGLDDEQIMFSFLSQYYLRPASKDQRPSKVVVGIALADKKDLEQYLADIFKHKVKVTSRCHASYKEYLSMALANAKSDLSRKLNDSLSPGKRLFSLQQALALPESISRIECFDISHTQGKDTVASCVVFTKDGCYKSDYRRFTISGITPGDDYAAMSDALERRYTKLKDSDSILPDLLLIDGGRGQLKQAVGIMNKLGLSEIELLAIAKGEGRKPGLETLFLYGGASPIRLPADHVALHLLQEIRDEAHRFAIVGHRSKRSKSLLASPLDDIEGVGAVRRNLLLRYFGGMQGVLQASAIDISKVPGISLVLAEAIYKELH